MKTQGIDGAIDTVQLSIVSSPVHMSIGVVKPAWGFQVSSPASRQSTALQLLRGGINDNSLPTLLSLFFFIKQLLCIIFG